MNPCVMAKDKIDEEQDRRWDCMHYRYSKMIERDEPNILFIGDETLKRLEMSSIWPEQFRKLNCLNFGIEGDKIENVLWRIENGQVSYKKKKLKAIVFYAGANNVHCTSQQIFEGICVCIMAIRRIVGEQLPIFIPTLLPRGQYTNPLRDRFNQVNNLLMHKFVDEAQANNANENVHVVKIDGDMLDGNNISMDIMYDYYHLTDIGYHMAFQNLYNKLAEMFPELVNDNQ